MVETQEELGSNDATNQEDSEAAATIAETSDALTQVAPEVISVPGMNISNIDQVLPTSICRPAQDSNYIALNDAIDLSNQDLTFQINTEFDPLKLRSATGTVISEVPKDATVQNLSETKIFAPNSTTQILMIKVRYGSTEGFAAAPYLKMPSAPADAPTIPAGAPVEASPVSSPAASLERPVSSTEVAATRPEEFHIVSDSNGEGIANRLHGISRSSDNGANTSVQLQLFSASIANGDLTGVKSCLFYGAGNNFTGFRSNALSRAEEDTQTFIQLCRGNNIQPVLATMFHSISDNPESVPATPEERQASPRMQFIRNYNQMIIRLAGQNSIPLYRFDTIPNESMRVHPPAVYSQIAPLITNSFATSA